MLTRLASCACLLFSASTLFAASTIERHGPAEYTGLGNDAFESKQYDRAISLYEQALADDPKYHYAIFNMAVTYQKKNNHDKAREYYQRAIDIEPDNADAHNNLGFITYRYKNYRSSIRHFTDAANITGNHPLENADYYYNLATAHEQLGEWDDARKAYINAISNDPNHYSAHYNLGSLYLGPLGNYVEAQRLLEKAHAIDNKQADPLLNLATLAEKTGRGKQPVDYLTQAVKVAPAKSAALARALWRRATYYRRLVPPKSIDMKEDLIAITRIDEYYPGVNGLLGRYYNDIADFSRAIVFLEKEVEGDYYDVNNEIDLECHYLLSQIYIEHELNANKALKHAKIYFNRFPNKSSAKQLQDRALRFNEPNSMSSTAP